MRPKILCSTTGKRCYGDSGVALREAVRLGGKRVYRCPFCGCLHLTSQPYVTPGAKP